MQDPATWGLIGKDFTEVRDASGFEAQFHAVKAYQKAHSPVYRRYEYTYLPVAAFKHAAITCFPPGEAAHIFESSGTSGQQRARHYVRDLNLYDQAIRTHWELVFGAEPCTLVAHLPGYAPQSSLVYMATRLMEWYGDEASGFSVDDVGVLERAIRFSTVSRSPFLLLGAAFGLLDLAEEHQWTLPVWGRVIETGGMKTHRRHMTRDALHCALASGFGLPRGQIWSEYGMCELLSQAYTRGGQVYIPPPWMRVDVFDTDGLEQPVPYGEVGVLGIVDLANVHTVSAILTEDLGRRHEKGFEVLGRLPHSEMRGCNFLLSDA